MAAKKQTPRTQPKTTKPKAKPVAKKTPAKSAPSKAKKPPAKPVAKKQPTKPVKSPAAKKPKVGTKPAAKKPATAAKKPQPAKKPAAKAPVAKSSGPAKPTAAKAKTAAKPKTSAPAKSADKSTEKSAATAKAVSGHSPAFILKQRQKLLDLRDSLVDSMSGISRDTIRNAPEGSEASGSGQHQGDAGSDAYDRDFALSVLAKEQDALYEIEQALRRIQAGTYGICEMSQKKIPQARLEAIPFARLTVECQAQWEKDYGNRRFRSSNEVGFSGGHYADDEDSESVSLDEEED
jgi:RNA polymerase-binding transcription factor DksA